MMTTSIRLISDGIIKFDGGSMFGQVPKTEWEEKVTTDRKNRITLGLNCLLLQTAGRNILIDTGIGSKETNGLKETYGLVPSRLVKGLKSLGITPKDIDMVILTHLHFDHCGGCTRLDRTGNLTPAFPNATYYIQSSCWEEASQPSERCQGSYKQEDFVPIEESGQLELLDGDYELLPGLWVKVTGGHARGHQGVILNHGGEKVAFLGDLVPTPYHLNPVCTSAFDQFPEESLAMKRQLLDQAVKEGWLIVFSHGYEYSAGDLTPKLVSLASRVQP